MIRKLLLCLALCAALPNPGIAQPNLPAQANRMAAHPDLTLKSTVSGYVPAWARNAEDLGAIPATTPLHLALQITRSPERQAAFTRLLADQQNPASPSYHHWLTPQQVGQLYGPTQDDLDSITAWLAAQGISRVNIAPSRVFIDFTASAATASQAFAVELHSFRLDGVARTAPLAEPSVPTALLPLVGSITGLAHIPIQPMHREQSHPGPASPTDTSNPALTFKSGDHFVTPGDFSTIFDLKSLYSAGYNGAGQKVAIIGRSRVASTDVSEFEASTGLPTNLPNTIIPPDGGDPGITNDGDQGEATLDVLRLIGTAPGVQADLVVSAGNANYDGVYIAAQYEVQTLLDPVMNISFGACEVYAGPGGVALWDTLFAQAASEGISVFVSSADSGAATCDAQFSPAPAFQFRSINYICASSYATCVGGTELAEAPGTQYWSTTNDSTLASALSYIPEGAWNEPGSENIVESGGGGASIYVPKPNWQAGTGVPADGARDVPDVSFPAAGHDAYYACYAAGNGDCANNRFEYFFGTSAAAPAMAGVTAILNGKTGTSHGNLNPLLYRIAAGTSASFHDATPASSGVADCSTSIPSLCNNSTPGDGTLLGGVAGFALTTGYDQATGLGSLDVANFINAASISAGALAPGTLVVSESSQTISRNQTAVFSAQFTSSTAAAPTGTVQFYADSAALGSAVPLVAGLATTSAQPFPAAGSYLVSAVYSGDTTFAQTTAPGISFTVTGATATPAVTIDPYDLMNPGPTPVGGSTTLSVKIPSVPGSPAPTGIVRFISFNTRSARALATVQLSNGSAQSPPILFPSPGDFTLVAYYLGDSVYSASSSVPLPYTIQRLKSTAQVSTSGGEIGVGGYQQFNVNIGAFANVFSDPQPTGSIQLFSNGSALGSPIMLAGDGTNQVLSPAEQFTSAGTFTLTAVYSGDTFWQPASSTAIVQIVTPGAAGYSLSINPSSLSLTAASAGQGSGTLTIATANGFQGTVNLACAVSYNGTGTPTSPPSCSLSNSAVAVQSASGSATVTVKTTAPHSQVALAKNRNTSFAAATSILAALLLLFLPRRRRLGPALFVTILFATFLAGLAGCGGSSTSANPPPPTPIPGTTAGSYTITITGTTSASGTPVPSPATIALTVI